MKTPKHIARTAAAGLAPRRGLRLSLALVSLGVLSFVIAGASQAGAPRTLTGEQLLATEEAGTSAAVGVCNPSGISTFRFTSSGLAYGKVVGTYTETGTFTFGPFEIQPDGGLYGRMLSFNSTFTIATEEETITGSMALSSQQDATFDYGSCGEILTPFGFPPTPTAVAIQARVDYTADWIIGNGNVRFSDIGTARVDYGDLGVRNTPFIPFRFVAFDFESVRHAAAPIGKWSCSGRSRGERAVASLGPTTLAQSRTAARLVLPAFVHRV